MTAPPLAPSRTAATLVWAGPSSAVVIAPAKVNLFLELHGMRTDGYHRLETLLVPVALFDTLEVRVADNFIMYCDTPGVPTDGSNLVAKAAGALSQAVGRKLGAEVRLTKRIPHAAGLGGGSADAAAMLVALDAIYDLRTPHETLCEVAARVGSDVPAFLVAPAAWCTGRGEVVSSARVGTAFDIDIVIVKPRAGLSTPAVYARATLPQTPTCGDAARQALASGDARAIAAALFNRLAEPAEGLMPELGAIRRAMVEAGALAATVSGSGSSVFAVCADSVSARRVSESVSGLGEVFMTRALSARDYGFDGVAS